jgi:threonine dehydratase
MGLPEIQKVNLVSLVSRICEARERIRPHVRQTPLDTASELGKTTGVSVFLKQEHLQHTGSFKFRGATNKISVLTPEQAAAGVIAASNGNHGLAVATAARARGIAAEVYVSTQVAPAKAARIERAGATLRYMGSEPLEAELAARAAAEASGKVFISPYNDLDVIAGQGTIAVEMLEQLGQIDAVFVAVGGGGLIGGIGAYLKSFSPQTEIIGSWPENSPVLSECIRAGRVIEVPEKPTLSESTAGGLERDSVTLNICSHVIDRCVLVSEAEILSAMRQILETEHWLIEAAAAVAVAAFIKQAERYEHKNVAVVLCGRNTSAEVLHKLALSLALPES